MALPLPVGVFTSQAANAISASFGQINANFYVDGQFGFNGNPGTSAGQAVRTMSALNLLLSNFRLTSNQPIVVAVSGVLTEEWSTPIISDVSLVGTNAGAPRQATSGGIPNGGGATWLSPTSGTGCLLTVNGQAWNISGFYFNNSATGAPCVRFQNVGDPPLTADGAWSIIQGCTLTGTDDGVSLMGGGGIVVQNNRFIGFSGSGDKALITESGAGGGTGSWARILNNDFLANATHISAVAHNWEIAGNHFSYINAGVTTTSQVLLAGGSNNSVHHNHFDIPYNTNGVTAMFSLGTNDRWGPNSFSTAVTTTLNSYGAPSS